ncbi:PQQ-binding-like beta-propeller repeat protein [Streptomyces sp. NPDC087263]|uniref:caspase, EACC1-associated type n=1 Tax=Streptomyces sp. NPDC087263 TaxID=3365773 RepID=UPI0037F25C7C
MGRRLALLIATYDYQDTGLRRLTAPAHDAEAFAAVLKDPDIAGFEVTTLINEPHHRVGEAIGDLYRDRRRDDLTLLYFTGHGLKDEDGRLYLATANTRRDSLLFTSLPAEQVDQAMSGSMSRQKVLILDCCYSGAFPAGRIAKADTDVHALERFQGRGRIVLTASDAAQYSFEGNQPHGEAAQSVFTRHLVAGLRDGSADLDGDGNITLDELYSYVHDRVVDEMPQQRPKKQDNVEGRIVIARNINWTLPSYLSNALGSPIATDRLAALDGLAHLHRIGNDNVRSHVREEIRRLADDDSRLVSAAAAARLRSLLPQPPETPREPPAGPVPDAAETATKTLPDIHPSAAPPPEHSSHGPDTATPRGVSPSPVRPTDRGAPTTGQPSPIPPSTSRPDTPGQPALDVSPPAARPAEPDLPALTGLNPTTSAVLPATSDATPHTANRQLTTPGPTPSRASAPTPTPLPQTAPPITNPVPPRQTAPEQNWTNRQPSSTLPATVPTGGATGPEPRLQADPPDQAPQPSAAPTAGPTGISRRRVLLGLAGTITATGLSVAGWYIVKTDNSRRPKWTFANGGSNYSSPLVSGGVVYVGGSDEYLYAVDAATGKQQWKFPTVTNADEPSSLAMSGGVVYVCGGKQLYAVDTATGKQRWKLPTGGNVYSPAVADGLVYVSSDEYLYAVDAATGKQQWKFPTAAGVFRSSPAVADGVVYVGHIDNGLLYALDAATGEQRWKSDIGIVSGAPPVVVGGVMYFTTFGGQLYAVDAATGKPQWLFINGGGGSPAVSGEVVYVGGGEYLDAVDAVTGKQQWRFPTGSAASSSPAVSGGVVYVSTASDDKYLYAVDAATGKQRWKFPTHEPASTPAVSGGLVYVSTWDQLYAVPV